MTAIVTAALKNGCDINYYDLNKEDGIDFLVTSDLKGMLTVKISEKHHMAKFFQKK